MMQARCDSHDSYDRLERRRSLLAEIPILRHCATDELDALASRIRVSAYPAGSLVMEQGESSRSWFFVAGGRVRLALFRENGREVTLAELGAGEFFGECALVDDREHGTSVLALTDLTVLTLPHEAFLAHMRAYPTTAVLLAAELADRLRTAHRAVAEMALHTVEERLTRTLERWGMQNGAEETDAGLLLPTRPTHQALAQMVGTSRETISRAFASLAKRGLLFARGGRLLLAAAVLER